jgi:phage protein D
MVQDMTDDPGVMGNLPRSRPGRRSSKRGGASEAAAPKPASEVTAQSSAKPKPSTAARGKSAAGRAKKPAGARTTAKRPASSASRARTRADSQGRAAAQGAPDDVRQEQATHGSTDPVTGAVLLAGKVVETGLKVAGGIVKRLPRP